MGKVRARKGRDVMTEREFIVMSTLIVVYFAALVRFVIVFAEEGYFGEGVAIVSCATFAIFYAIFGGWVDRFRGKGCG